MAEQNGTNRLIPYALMALASIVGFFAQANVQLQQEQIKNLQHTLGEYKSELKIHAARDAHPEALAATAFLRSEVLNLKERVDKCSCYR